ncbi:hypothetical protein AAFC00_006417 [Neodothiora populina]|uniref:Protoheme IX farnesyltransferase, mitochondrial n=1 Tax=Neodothiora populina TaxID=2781224 RepID=A0ABR3P545_9PEZI
MSSTLSLLPLRSLVYKAFRSPSSAICLRCANAVSGAQRQLAPQRRLLLRQYSCGSKRGIANVSAARQAAAAPVASPSEGGAKGQELDKGRYFWANEFRRRINESKENVGKYGHEGKKATEADAEMAEEAAAAAAATSARNTAATIGQTTQDENAATARSPRARARRKAAIAAAGGGQSSSSDSALPELPHDASAQLSHMAAASQASIKKRFFTYLALTKPRLAFLVVLTTAAGYSLYPVPSLLSSSATETPSLSGLTLLFLTTGTFATIASANTLNMLFEPAYDAQMSRTRNRPLVRKLISSRNAYMFAALSAVVGTGMLWYGVNPTTAVLGASNLVLYAFIYTPLKRRSVSNTWVGAVVGAIPPLMGWCAAGGQYAASTPPAYRSFSPLAGAAAEDDSITTTSTTSALWDEMQLLLFSPQAAGGWLLAALLFAWQFPHFNALSHPIRHEYRNAGYRMLVWYNPARNTRVGLRYSLAMFPICIGLSYVGVTDKYFILTSSLVNGWMAKEAWAFWRSGGAETKEAAKTARGLFWASVWHLPLVLVLAMCQKQGLWEGIWRKVFGQGGLDDDDGEWEYVDIDEDDEK